MYETKRPKKHYVLVLQDGEWRILEKAGSREELVERIAWRTGGFWRIYEAVERPLDNPILSDVNMNGNDVDVVRDWLGNEVGRRIRRFMIIDEDDRILDPREMKTEIDEAFRRVLEARRLRGRPSPCRFRREPVPYSGRGRRRKKRFRKMRNWFRNHRLDAIPEHERFVRKKAVVQNGWDDEPWESESRSWKDCGKVKRQWDKRRKRNERTFRSKEISIRKPNPKNNSAEERIEVAT